MQEFFNGIWGLLSQVIDRTGTKFALAAGSVAGILWLVYKGGIPGSLGTWGTVAVLASVTAINVAYFIWRRAQEKEQASLKIAPLQTDNGSAQS